MTEIPEGMPTPKTYKEWAVAKLCGLDFEMPMKTIYEQTEKMTTMVEPGASGVAPLLVLSHDGISPFGVRDGLKVYVNGEHIAMSGPGVSMIEGRFYFVPRNGGIFIAQYYRYIPEEAVGKTYTVKVVYPEGIAIDGLAPKTPIEQYLDYAVAHKKHNIIE